MGEANAAPKSPVVERLVSLLEQGPIDLEIAILPTIDAPEKLTSLDGLDVNNMLVLAEGHLGIDARGFPLFIRDIRRAYKEFEKKKATTTGMDEDVTTVRTQEQLQLTACLLLFNPDHSTAWADRRRGLLEISVDDSSAWNRETQFLDLLMTQHTKA
jgi:hypothetical protein